jgi:prephenate dehydrogenase
VAVALAARLHARIGDEPTAALCGPGMRSMTRLGASAWTMWREVLRTNGPLVAQEVREMLAILSDAADALESGAVARLEPQFEAAASVVRRLNANNDAGARVDREHQALDERTE